MKLLPEVLGGRLPFPWIHLGETSTGNPVPSKTMTTLRDATETHLSIFSAKPQ